MCADPNCGSAGSYPPLARSLWYVSHELPFTLLPIVVAVLVLEEEKEVVDELTLVEVVDEPMFVTLVVDEVDVPP
jgi:hypothetical protein